MEWKAKKSCFIAMSLIVSSSSGMASGSDDDNGGQNDKQPYITAMGAVGVCTFFEGFNIGNVCFGVKDEQEVEIEIEDRYFDTVRGMYRFFEGQVGLGGDAVLLEQGLFCTSTQVDVPAGADHLVVYVDGQIPTWWECDALEGATMGNVVLTRDPDT